jgi:hypothetical protein
MPFPALRLHSGTNIDAQAPLPSGRFWGHARLPRAGFPGRHSEDCWNPAQLCRLQIAIAGLGQKQHALLFTPNRQNAELSCGPVTVGGKARVAQNAAKFGLFSVANFVRPDEQDTFDEFESGYIDELSPASPLEQTLAREIIHAAWRLRRCANLEAAPPQDLTDEELDRLQISIDGARSAAQRTFHRSLKELRRLQTQNLHPAEIAIKQAMAMDALLKKDLDKRQRQLTEPASADSAKQTQSQPAQTRQIPRSAPCPCKSGQKYKRCCGKNAPPARGSAVPRHQSVAA